MPLRTTPHHLSNYILSHVMIYVTSSLFGSSGGASKVCNHYMSKKSIKYVVRSV